MAEAIDTVWELPRTETTDKNIKVQLRSTSLDHTECINFVKCPQAGAVIYFGGTTRDNFDSKVVKSLSYEAHKKLALRSIYKICVGVKSKYTNDRGESCVHKIMVLHRLGDVPVMDDSVMICISSTHRKEGWDAAMVILELIKEKAEIWKNEKYDDDSTCWKANDTSNVIHR